MAISDRHYDAPMHLRHTVAVLAIVATACSTTSSPSAADNPRTSGPLSITAAPLSTNLLVDGPTPVALPGTELPYAPIRSSRAPSGNLAERPISNGGIFAPLISFLADPEPIRIDLAVVSGDLYISVASATDSVLTRATLTNDGIALNAAVQWAGAGPDPVFGSVGDNVGFVDLPDRTAQTGAVPFGDGWAWVSGEDIVAIGTPNDYSETPVNLLDDTLLATDGAFIVALTDPVSRLNHGIVGDAIEGGGFVVIEDNGTIRSRVILDDPDVIEGRSAMLGDVTGNGETEIVVTISNAAEGSRVAVFDLDGTLIAESVPIGQGNRWRHQLAIVEDPGGSLILNVLTPHIGGGLQALRLVDGRLESVAIKGDYSSHTINSRTLDGAYVGDLDGDGKWEVLVPNQRRNTLVALALEGDDFQEDFTLVTPEGARFESNIAVIDWGDRTVIAIVTVDGVAAIWVTRG